MSSFARPAPVRGENIPMVSGYERKCWAQAVPEYRNGRNRTTYKHVGKYIRASYPPGYVAGYMDPDIIFDNGTVTGGQFIEQTCMIARKPAVVRTNRAFGGKRKTRRNRRNRRYTRKN